MEDMKKFLEQPENVKFLSDLLAKSGGVLTTDGITKLFETFGAEIQEQLTKKWEEKFGRIENILTSKELDKPKGAFKNFADYVKSVKQYQTEENINKLKTLRTDTEGDFLIPVEYARGLLSFDQGSNDFMSAVTKFPLRGNSYRYRFFKDKDRTSANYMGGVVSYWVGEGKAPTASDMKFGEINFRLHDLALLILATDDMIEDAPEAVSGMIEKAFRSRINYDLENIYFNGNGAGQPLGILNSGALVVQAKKTSQASDTIVSENLIAMKNRLAKGCLANAVWSYAPTVATEVQNCKIGASDFPAFIPAGAMSANQTLDTILGRPAFESEHLSAALGDEKDIILHDPTQFALAYKNLTSQVESSAHLYFDSFQTAFRLKIRIDGQPLWDTYITPAHGSITKSPFVTLAART